MNYNEILEFLENNGTSVDEFAYETVISIPEDFVASTRVQELRVAKQKARQELDDSESGWSSENPLYKAWSDIPDVDAEIQKEYLESVGIGEIIQIEQYGGEDMGSTWYSIKYFPQHDIHIKVSGWYQSYHGTDFEDWSDACSEVKPVTKTVTVFE